jgi:hypothetical protein
MTCGAVVLELRCGNSLFRNVSDEYMGCISVALRVNGVFGENGHNDLTALHCTPHSTTDRVKGSFNGSTGISCEHMRVFLDLKIEPRVI